MKQVGQIKIKEDSDLWKSIQKSRELDPEKAAARAAEKARKEVQEEIAKREAERKAYLDSLRFLENLEFKTQNLRDQIKKCEARRAKLRKQASEEWDKEEQLIKEIQKTCTHEMCIEMQITYKDEYDDWHDSHYERKCIECFLVEESSTPINYARFSSERKYHKLEKSQVVLLRQTVDDKEYELEFDDLKWSVLQ